MPEPAHLPSESRVARGIMLRCLAVACFAVMAGAMKWASQDRVTEVEMLFFRSVFGLPVVLAWIALGPGIGVIRTRRPRAHLIRSMIGITGILLNFGALIRLPLADAVTIGFSAPIFATILSMLLLGEKVGVQRWAAVALGFAGVAMIVRPGGVVLDHVGLMMAIGGALGTAGVTVTIRQLGATEHPGAIVFWFFCCSCVVSGIGTLFVAQPHSASAWGALALAGVAGAAAQVLMTSSLHAAPVSVVAPFDYLQIIWATAIGWLIWAVVPETNTLFGAALIVAGGLYTAWREHRLRRERIAATPPLE
jgi:drug/metabolite transporter (DMT)-like permease